MNLNPLTNRPLPHKEVVRRFLEGLRDGSQPKQPQAAASSPTEPQVTGVPEEPQATSVPAERRTTGVPEEHRATGPSMATEQLVTIAAAEELARWFNQ